MDRITFHTYQRGHGFFKGKVRSDGIAPTIDATIHFWHTILIVWTES